MSLLNLLQAGKNTLKPTKTIITTVDGRKLTEDGQVLSEKSCGFVIDTKPDKVPAEIIPKHFLGSQDCVDLEILNQNHIKNILSIGIKVDIDLDSSITRKFLECLDLPETNIKPLVEEANKFIYQSLEEKKVILVHCNAGVSRSSMIVIAYLITCVNMTYEEAFSLVKSKRECIRPNDGFIKQLKALSSK